MKEGEIKQNLRFMGNGSLNDFICTFFIVLYSYICNSTLALSADLSRSLLDTALTPLEWRPLSSAPMAPAKPPLISLTYPTVL